MFKGLRDKLSGWFKKKPEVAGEEKTSVPPARPKKEEKAEEKAKKKVKKEEKAGKEERKAGEKKEEVSQEERVEELKEDVEEIEEELDAVKRGEELPALPPKEESRPSAQTLAQKEEAVIQQKPVIEPKVEEKKEKKPQLADAEKVIAAKEEEEKEGFGFFAKIKKRLTESELTQAQFDEAFEELEMTLLENNVALEVVDKIHDSLSKDLVKASVKKDKVEETIIESLKDSILEVLVEGEDLIGKIKSNKEWPFVILFFGINGSGKTTSIAKFASRLKSEGVSCVLGAADTFRAASIEQLEKHANKVGVPIVKGDYGQDPSAVAFDTISYAKKNKIQVVLVDTAGRMYTQGNLMREMEKIVRVAKPDFKIFVGESITGNDAVLQAKSFNDSVGIDGVILSKADVDEKAGTILSVGFVTGKPVLFLGVGQGYGDLKEFKKKDVLKNLGLG